MQAEAIPEKRTGRPRAYPAYMWVVFEAAVSIWGSARNVEAQFDDSRVWRFIRHTAKGFFPDEPSKWLPEMPMRRCHYLYARRYLADPGILKRRQEIFTTHAVALAQSIGLMDCNGPGSLTHPDLARMVHGDGKVVLDTRYVPFSGKGGEAGVAA